MNDSTTNGSGDRYSAKWIKAMRIGNFFGCHQMPARSFFYNNYQFPVCARCTGVILAALIAIPLFMVYKLNIYIALALSSVMLIDWGIQYLGIKESTNTRRFVTGFIGGFGWTYVYLYFYVFLYDLIKALVS